MSSQSEMSSENLNPLREILSAIGRIEQRLGLVQESDCRKKVAARFGQDFVKNVHATSLVHVIKLLGERQLEADELVHYAEVLLEKELVRKQLFIAHSHLTCYVAAPHTYVFIDVSQTVR
jgi:hypothetical protein